MWRGKHPFGLPSGRACQALRASCFPAWVEHEVIDALATHLYPSAYSRCEAVLRINGEMFRFTFRGICDLEKAVASRTGLSRPGRVICTCRAVFSDCHFAV